jgi:hypothetical protein
VRFPKQWDQLAVVFPYKVVFGSLDVNIAGTTHGINGSSLKVAPLKVAPLKVAPLKVAPLKVAPVLVVICAVRGTVSFGLSNAVLPSMAALGHDGIMNILGDFRFSRVFSQRLDFLSARINIRQLGLKHKLQ